MRAVPPRVLMAGTAPAGRGGVAAVVSALRRHGLFERERVRYVATHTDGGRAAKAWYALAGLGLGAWLCLAQRPAVVHVHAASHASFARKAALLLVARLAGCRTVFHLHGGGFRRFATQEAGSLQRRWIRHTLERSSAVVTLSDGWAGFVREFAPAARTVVVPNPVALPAAAHAQDITVSKSEQEPQRILFLGRIEAAKGVFELLAAGARLAPAFPALRLVFGGEGEARALAALRRRAGELGMLGRIELPGWLGPLERDAELARAGLFCLPSHAEGLPMAMLEAMAVGRAVVASRVGAVPEALRDGDNGLLVAPGDVDALAAALASVMGDGALRARLGRHARATVAAHYSTEVVCGRLSALYRELAGTR